MNKIMKRTFLLLSMLLATLTCFASDAPKRIEDVDKYLATPDPDSDNIVWYRPSASKESPFRVYGFAWFEQEGVYERLPQTPNVKVPDAVAYLAKHTAGGQIRFRTNSSRVLVKAKTRGFGVMGHMAQTGSGGFDLYVGEGSNQIFSKTTTYPLGATEFKSILFSQGNGEMHDFTINFPLYNGVESVEIGIDKDAKLETPLAFEDDRPIIIYGTSITQGGCASRPGSLFTNILSRRLNVPFINLGFSGSGKGEPEMAELLCQIPNPRLIILDYEANADLDMDKTLGPFMEIIRKNHPEIPVLIITRIRFADEAILKDNKSTDSRSYHASTRYAHQKNEYDKWIAKGDKNIYFLDGGTILGDDYADCTVDGIHPTDMGFFRMADGIEPTLAEILAKYPPEKK